MRTLAPVDLAVLAIFGIAILRGLYRGLVREAFSIAAVGAACIAVRLFAAPAAREVLAATGWSLDETAARWIAGAVIAVAAVALVAVTGRLMRSGARAAGLGWADRLGGVALGGAEGAVVAALALLIAAAVLGRDHPSLDGSQSFEAFEQLEQVVRAQVRGTIDVAAPPDARRR